MLRIRRYGLILVLLAIGAMTGTACKQSAEQLNQKGNDRFAEEAYLEALHAYHSAQIESPELAEPYYNAANALYREGAFDEALAQLEQALQFAQLNEDTVQSLAQHGFYNLGNTSYNQESWEEAIAAYREALLRNPGDQDAKYNLELALQQLQQQQQREQEQQDQDQQQEQQQQDQNQEQQNEDQQQEQSDNGEGQENEQEESQDQSQGGENGEQEEDQENSDSKAGNEGEQEQNQSNQSQNGQEQGEEGTSPGTVPPSGRGMTAEQAEQLLAAIAAGSDTLQERLGQIFVVPSLPPVQDW